MTQEDKELLLKDLCARLPYGVKYKDVTIDFVGTIMDISMFDNMCRLFNDYGDNYTCFIMNCKPYLFPMSSMTEEQRKEFDRLLELELKALNDEIDHIQATAFEVDFYHKHHLDWRGLIPKGLAIDATGLNIYCL